MSKVPGTDEQGPSRQGRRQDRSASHSRDGEDPNDAGNRKEERRDGQSTKREFAARDRRPGYDQRRRRWEKLSVVGHPAPTTFFGQNLRRSRENPVVVGGEFLKVAKEEID